MKIKVRIFRQSFLEDRQCCAFIDVCTESEKRVGETIKQNNKNNKN